MGRPRLLAGAGGSRGTLAAGLPDEQDNEISSWLPGDAESTLALEQQIALGSDPDIVPAVVVYERDGGLTPADLDAIAQDAQAFAQSEGLDGEVVGPIPSEDGEAAQVIVPLNAGAEGGRRIAPLVDDLRAEASDAPDGLDVYVSGPGRATRPTPPRRSPASTAPCSSPPSAS